MLVFDKRVTLRIDVTSHAGVRVINKRAPSLCVAVTEAHYTAMFSEASLKREVVRQLMKYLPSHPWLYRLRVAF